MVGGDTGPREERVFCDGKCTNHGGSTEMYNQRLNYLHWNPLTAGFVAEPWHWIYSSAIDYFLGKKGLLDVIILDGF